MYVCTNFGENRSRNATVRVLADGQTDRLTDANRFYNLSHAICYSYGTDKYNLLLFSAQRIRVETINMVTALSRWDTIRSVENVKKVS